MLRAPTIDRARPRAADGKRTPTRTQVGRALSPLGLIFLVGRIVPFDPTMPSRGLDASWQWALNEAAARRMSFGEDVVFTGGPASAVVTAAFHPATYAGIVVLTCLLALALWISLRLACGRSRELAAGAGAIALAGVYDREGLLLVVPLVALLALVRVARDEKSFSMLGPVCLVALTSAICVVAKGSMFITAASAVTSAVLILMLHRRWRDACVACIVPAVALVAIWLGLGQPVRALVPYLRGVVALAANYSDSMSGGDVVGNLALVFATSLLGGLLVIGLARQLGQGEGLVIGAGASITVFTAVKLGMVRADQHVITTLSALVALSVLVWTLSSRDRVRIVIGLAGLSAVLAAVYGVWCLVFLMPVHQGQSALALVDAARRTVEVEPSLSSRYQTAVDALKRQTDLPALAGTVDTYSYDQSDVIAEGLEWAPRPVIQSYAAFSPDLAELNRQHLLGSTAPEWIVFAPQPIDQQYPSAEDGPSWPEFLHRYDVSEAAGGKLILHRRAIQPAEGGGAPGVTIAADLGKRVTLGSGTPMRFVTFEIDPSTLGRAALLLYKSEPLRLTVWTADGVQHGYRLPLGMARAGFLLSPMTSTASEFGSLYGNPSDYETRSRTVVALRVDSSGLLWNQTYRFTVSPVAPPPG